MLNFELNYPIVIIEVHLRKCKNECFQGQSPKGGRQPRKARPPPPPPPPPVHTSPDPLSQLTHENLAWERQKVDKDQANRHRQSHSQCGLQ